MSTPSSVRSLPSAPSPVPVPEHVHVHPGPALLAGIEDGPSLAAHRAQHGPLRPLDLAGLRALVLDTGLRGRGGAAFPFARKLDAAASGRRPVVVVNLAEGEPASAKDTALALTRPHLVLDGAIAVAHALGAREVHVVLPGDRPRPRAAMRAALAERRAAGTGAGRARGGSRREVRLVEHVASPRFVAGQARAVLELLAGRPNLPVTAWTPEAVRGHEQRPTLLSNAETWAHVGRLVLRGAEGHRARGTAQEPGTTLLTLSAAGSAPHVHEVAHGDRLRPLLDPSAFGRPALVGGFHGSWTTWPTLAGARVSVAGFTALGSPLGAGVVHTPGDTCPVATTAAVVDYLAAQSARRCGPCLNGLPALAAAVHALDRGEPGALERVEQLAGVLPGRGACAHPDGTVRLVRSLLRVLPDEVDAHRGGRACPAGSGREVAP